MRKNTTIFLFLIISIEVLGQAKFNVSEESTMSISGTSTIHDWTSTVNEIKGEYVFKENILKKKLPVSESIINHVKIVIPVKSIESPRGEAMDNKTQNALKAEEHPDIIFELTDGKIISTGDKSDGSFMISVTGELTIAGHSENVKFGLEGQRLNSEKLTFKGSYTFNMTDYEVEPPSAMFGQIKTGEEVTVDFELILVKE